MPDTAVTELNRSAERAQQDQDRTGDVVTSGRARTPPWR